MQKVTLFYGLSPFLDTSRCSAKVIVDSKVGCTVDLGPLVVY